ncbi:DNA replication and repair protein RecF [Jatrophihabitans endophyticus]|uniref:DNA replication and repair protein RecF n=1 Tax=Jatrophihabitans endophyticus TaxID=1206085 RepID=A0A1M5HW74_9ACTN|nr:DNA replication/repair protein RecF [Jatrophihabitans endophyticus]SHG20206.1 DNA replication and repair protein RecF [Jatrophihabitans endophyticus]
MYVRHLSVADFRSWPTAELALEPGANVLLGRNGQGKTNLVEALGYLASLSSHRVSTDAPLIRAGAERAVTRAAVVAADRELRVEVEIVAGRANRAKLGGAPVPRPRDVLGVLRTVLFAPEDLAIVRGDPSERRRFLDELVVARTPRLAGVRADYERVLKQRGALLKSAGGRRGSAARPADLTTLDVWDGHLATHGAELLRARLTTLRALRPHAAAAYAQVAPSSSALRAGYSTSLSTSLPALVDPSDDPDTVPPLDEVREALLAGLAAARPAELDRGVNLVGPHRDDLELALGDLPLRGYASHGEGWSAALSLRLGSYELLRSDAFSGGDPVLVLDDVFAELDAERRAQLALVAAGAEQAIVTAAVEGDVPPGLRGTRFEVGGGTVRRVH